jgi:hypothetical protein
MFPASPLLILLASALGVPFGIIILITLFALHEEVADVVVSAALLDNGIIRKEENSNKPITAAETRSVFMRVAVKCGAKKYIGLYQILSSFYQSCGSEKLDCFCAILFFWNSS